MYKLDYHGATETGRRAENQDSFILFKNKHHFLVAVVADGMGGHKGGATASKAIIKMVKREINDIDFNGMDDEVIRKILLSMVRVFQKDLKRIGVEFPQYADMGSTLNMNLFVGGKMYTVNIGDSRTQSFLKRNLVKISKDHNMGTLAETDPRYHHYKGQYNMLTSSLGPNKKTTADLFITDLSVNKKGYILMTSDGVHNSISEAAWIKIIKASGKTLQEKVAKTIRTAFENGSTDNMTFILIRYER